MGLLDRLLGREEPRPDRSRPAAGTGSPAAYGTPAPYAAPPPREPTAEESDARAVERYRYLLRTAPPETIEQAHAEAFAQLTPEQRRQVLAQLGAEVPAEERAASDDPRSLARMATRAELRRPGTLERSFGGVGSGAGGMGMGGLVAGTLLSTIAGAFIGTAIADAMFDMSDSSDGSDTAGDAATDGSDGGAEGESWADGGDGGSGWDEGSGWDGGGDLGGDFGGGDFGGEF